MKSQRIRNLSGGRRDPDLQIVAVAGGGAEDLVTVADFRLCLQKVCTLQKLEPEETEDLILWSAITLQKWRPARADPDGVEKSKKKRP